MGSLLIGMGLGMITVAVVLIAGLGVGAALGGYVISGVLGTLGSAGWMALRAQAQRRISDLPARTLVLHLD